MQSTATVDGHSGLLVRRALRAGAPMGSRIRGWRHDVDGVHRAVARRRERDQVPWHGRLHRVAGAGRHVHLPVRAARESARRARTVKL